MSRAFLILVVLAGAAHAQKARTPKQAKAANKIAFEKALAKLAMKPVKLAAVPADPEESTGDGHFVGNVVMDKNGHNDPVFVVDGQKGVFRVVKKMTTVGRVKENVCHAGPVMPLRVKRTRFDVPAGHVFKGDVEVRFDGFVVDEQNTCR